MSQFNRFAPPQKVKVVKKTASGKVIIDYKDVDKLRRMMSPNGKIFTKKRTSSTAGEQRMLSQAIKRARFMGLLPYTSATL
ncbi:MAG TPA: 30S ribosomal protein S18 [Phycisphaerales bacterium]|nr:30S ribosomal protein S18 [Phycisphaerales bacterium]